MSGGNNLQKKRLAAAYAATSYIADGPDGPIALRVGEASPALDRWLAAEGVSSWAWLTAVNPGSRRLGEAENRARLDELEAALAAAGWRWLAGRAVADDGGWPDEASLLVAGLEGEAACALARRFGQAALLEGFAGGVPALVWLEGGD